MNILHITPDDLANVCHKSDITYLALFGSAARGEEKQESDIDLLARFSKPKSLLELVRIERVLAGHFGGPIDLLTEASISPYIRDRIARDLRVLYEQ